MAQSSSSKPTSVLSRGFHQVQDLFYHPFSTKALEQLPRRNSIAPRTKSKRADRIPNVENESGIQPLVRDYQSTGDSHHAASQSIVRVPKKVATPVKVETKVWLANERTWISYISISVLMSSLSLALWNASKDGVGRRFGWVYAGISILTLIYGFAVFQKRLTMIASRQADQFDDLLGPLLISAALFIAVLSNFIIKYNDMRQVMKATYTWAI